MEINKPGSRFASKQREIEDYMNDTMVDDPEP